MKKLALYAFALWMLWLNVPATASPYRLTLLRPPPFSFVDRTFVQDINNAGQIVGNGSSDGPRVDQRAMLWSSDGTPTYLPHYGMDPRAFSEAFAMNDVGQVIGRVTGDFGSNGLVLWNDGRPTELRLPAGLPVDINNAGQMLLNSVNRNAAVWDGTTLTPLGTPEGASHARAMNDAGWAVGDRYTASGGARATLWRDGETLDLGTLGGTDSHATNINASGLVVGYSALAGDLHSHATLWRGTEIVDLGDLSGNGSIAWDVNAQGTVVGWSFMPRGVHHATLWDGTTMTDLNSFVDAATAAQGWELWSAIAVNDQGWIVGNAYNTQTSESLGYVLAPVPEPSSIALMLAGLMVAGLALRRRQ